MKMRGGIYPKMNRGKLLVFVLVFSIILSGSSLFNIRVYADNFEDDEKDYYYWKNYWENQNNINNDNTIDQDNNTPENNYYDEDDEDYIPEPKEPEELPVDMTNVTLEKEDLEGVLISGESAWDNELEFKIKVNSEVLLNPYEDTGEDDEDYEDQYVNYLKKNAQLSVESLNEDMYFYASLRNNILRLTTTSSGKTTLKITINDKEFSVKVKIVRVGFKESSTVLVKGKSKELLTAGSKKCKIKLKSSKPGVVSVSKTGKVKALKEGNAIITGEIDGKKIYALVSSVSEVRKKAIKWAVDYSSKSEYSQPKRMQKGYYDCSSLVWRAYNKFGVNLGGLNYAPTAAELCRIYDKKKRTMSDEKTYEKDNILNFLPGDLMFYSGEKNGRYKDIYHVEMISGLYFYGLDEKGNPNVSVGVIRVSPSGNMTLARVQVK